MDDIFAPGGPVAGLLGSTYRPRPGQVRMAKLVQHVVANGGLGLVEAGTGSGKSFAYLIPLIWSGSRAFVSTANKTLQNQLWEKDLPALRRIAPRQVSAALLKGRANYICRYKLEEQSRQPALLGRGLDLPRLLARLETSATGDVEELRLYGEQREALTAGRRDCLGPGCPHARRCYYEHAALLAEKADIVILNHALLALNLALAGAILEPRDVIVIDEAHEFESYVLSALRLQLDYDQVPSFINHDVVTRNADDAVRGRAVSANHELFTYLGGSAGGPTGGSRRWAGPADLPLAATLAVHLGALRDELIKKAPSALAATESGGEEAARYQTVVEWAGGLVGQLEALSRPVPEDAVRYCERTPGKTAQAQVVVCQEPLDVAGFLREHLWSVTRTVICTSATLTTGGQFEHFCRRTGAPPDTSIRRAIPSPFDFGRQALLYTPHGLIPQYDDGEDSYVESLVAEVERLVEASRGRAFVLCTSMARATQLHDRLEPRLTYTCLCQGAASREDLLDAFRSDPGGAVLFATKSFWEGVDIPGEALSLVIIDKLPFAPPADPVVRQREQRIRAAGGDAFGQFMLPEAILALKQGLGRLIRSETDRGVMAILDSRVNVKSYGSRVIASLPPARRTFRFEDVREFFSL